MDRAGAGGLLVGAQPGAAYGTYTEGIDTRVTTVDTDFLAEAAGTRPATRPVRFTGYHPVSAAAAGQWRRTRAFCADTLAMPETAGSPLLVGNVQRLLAAVTLTTFPNTITGEETPADRTDAGTVTLRRAVAFIDDHAHTDIGVAEIARAAYVTPRAIQIAFRRHLDTTPMAYLRRTRLDAPPTATWPPPTRQAATPSPPSPPAGASRTPAASPPPTAAPTASPPAPPCTPDDARWSVLDTSRNWYCRYAGPVSRLERITTNPAVCHGRPTIPGLRYPVESLLELLSAGMTIDDVRADYPDLEGDDLFAALEYGALTVGGGRAPTPS